MRNVQILLLLWFLISCETKIYSSKDRIEDRPLANQDELQSDLDFDGIQSVSNITASSVDVFWNEVLGATSYYIYLIKEDNAVLYEKVPAPSESVKIEGLKEATEYKIQVRALNSKSLLDSNTKSLPITTLSTPPDKMIITRIAPLKVNDISLRPQFFISGLNSGDEVILYSDNCSTEVARSRATGESLTLTSKKLEADVSYQFYAKRINSNNVESDCSRSFATYNPRSCPQGYILVDTGSNIGVSDFCVMKHEARAWLDLDADNFVDVSEIDSDGCADIGCANKNWGLDVFSPGSTSEGTPWRMINLDNAKAECRSLGEHFDLISNREWMAIAQNIEKQDQNWSGSLVGSGCLFRGNNGVDDACGYNFDGIHSGPIAVRELESTTFVHTLVDLSLESHEIYDFSGNLAEWVNFKNEKDTSVTTFNCPDSWSEISINFCQAQINPIDYLFLNPAGIANSLYNSDFGLGKTEGGSDIYLVRGGSHLYGAAAGIYSASFAQTKETARADIGFRCVFRRSSL